MPVYRVTHPDGRKARVTGDRPPTEAELEDLFASLTPAASEPPLAPAQERLLGKAPQTGEDSPPSQSPAMRGLAQAAHPGVDIDTGEQKGRLDTIGDLGNTLLSSVGGPSAAESLVPSLIRGVKSIPRGMASAGRAIETGAAEITPTGLLGAPGKLAMRGVGATLRKTGEAMGGGTPNPLAGRMGGRLPTEVAPPQTGGPIVPNSPPLMERLGGSLPREIAPPQSGGPITTTHPRGGPLDHITPYTQEKSPTGRGGAPPAGAGELSTPSVGGGPLPSASGKPRMSLTKDVLPQMDRALGAEETEGRLFGSSKTLRPSEGLSLPGKKGDIIREAVPNRRTPLAAEQRITDALRKAKLDDETMKLLVAALGGGALASAHSR